VARETQKTNKALIRNEIGKAQRSILRADFVMPSLNKGYELLRKIFILVAFYLFVFSVVSPFYHITFAGLESSDATYWSYKAEHSTFILKLTSGQSWFSDYWFDPFPYPPLMSWIPITVFIIQVLTLAFGCASIVVNRKVIVFASVCLSLSVLALMSYAGYELSSFNYGGGYQLSYYLVYPSVALFSLLLC
jgi:hypothetical protein